ncbi:hypothetical protein [Microbacterium sp. Root61]|uniref:hypothetical protein n=1 Tax=Microbacterium sp. Root61 TaxID=1736570 RepID=UPI000A56FAFB|nr:hypothetical protein [Microbacterium sp. Root61]
MREGRVVRSTTVVFVGCLVAVMLAGCGSSSPPTAEEIGGAEDARPTGVDTLASVEVPTPQGWQPIAERQVDGCGSLTNDRGGFDDAHVGGYSCALVRRTLYIRADEVKTSREDAAAYAAVAEISLAFADMAQQQDVPGLQPSERVPLVFGHVTYNGTRVSIEARIGRGQDVDIDILPLWHRNETVVSDGEKLVTQLKQQGRVADDVLQVTVTVPYFEVFREAA